MHRLFQAVLFFLTAMAAMAFATDDGHGEILFFSATGCNQNTDWMYCYNAGNEFCCQADGPFCNTLSCNKCDGYTLAAFQDTTACPGLGQADAKCTPGSSTNCCVPVGGHSKCTGAFYDSGSKQRGAVYDPTPATNSTCHTPDGMVFHDAAGVRHEITNMTTETYQKALSLYQKGDIGGLTAMVPQAQG